MKRTARTTTVCRAVGTIVCKQLRKLLSPGALPKPLARRFDGGRGGRLARRRPGGQAAVPEPTAPSTPGQKREWTRRRRDHRTRIVLLRERCSGQIVCSEPPPLLLFPPSPHTHTLFSQTNHSVANTYSNSPGFFTRRELFLSSQLLAVK